MSGSLSIGKVFGIQLRLHYSWFVIFVLVTVSLVEPAWSSAFAWAIGIATSLLFFGSVVAHEMAHSLVARANNIPVASITLFIFGGVSMMTREPSQPSAELKMAAAGPACSAVIGGIFLAIRHLSPSLPPPVADMVFLLMFMNFALAVFNLIPGFPLDGGRIFRAAIWRTSGDYRRSTRIAARVGQGVGYFFIAGGITIAILSVTPGSYLVPGVFSGWFSGIWIAFIGWFLLNAARTSYQQTEWRETLRGVTAGQVANTSYPSVPAEVTLDRLVADYILRSGHRFFVVMDGARVQGVLPLDRVKAVPRVDWPRKTAGEVAWPLYRLGTVRDDQDALSAIEGLAGGNASLVVVLKDGQFLGLITRDDLARFLRTHAELGG